MSYVHSPSRRVRSAGVCALERRHVAERSDSARNPEGLVAKKFRKLTMNPALTPEVVTKGLLADRLNTSLLPVQQQRFAPLPSFAVHARQTPPKVTSFASRRRNH